MVKNIGLLKKGIQIFIALCLIIIWTSCNKQTSLVQPLLQSAQDLLEVNPDSALTILEQVQNPQALNKSLYYQFFLVQIQAKDKSYKDITSDTLIFDIKQYYEDKKDIENAAMATFYSGRILQEKKEYENALLTYLGYKKYTNRFQNNNLKGLFESSIAQIHFDQFLFEDAIKHYKRAEQYFQISKNHKNRIVVNRLIGTSLFISGEKDSGFVYFFKTLELADSFKIKSEQFEARNNLGFAYLNIEDWQKSEAYYLDAWNYINDSLGEAKLASNIAMLYINISDNDSAKYYLKKAIDFIPQKKDKYLISNIYKTLSSIEESENNFKDALKAHKLYSKHVVDILDETRINAVYEIEKKYNFQVLETKNQQLLIERQRILLISLLILLALSFIILFIVRRAMLNENKLKEANVKILQMKDLAHNYNKREKSLHNILISHFDIIKKSALLEGYLIEEKRKSGEYLLGKFNEIVYGQKNIDWDLIYQTLNKINHNSLDKLRIKFPQLGESEFRICCLTYLDFNNTEIAIILKYSLNTIQAKKSAIRKKIGLKNFGNIHDYLHESLLSKQKSVLNIQ